MCVIQLFFRFLSLLHVGRFFFVNFFHFFCFLLDVLFLSIHRFFDVSSDAIHTLYTGSLLDVSSREYWDILFLQLSEDEEKICLPYQDYSFSQVKILNDLIDFYLTFVNFLEIFQSLAWISPSANFAPSASRKSFVGIDLWFSRSSLKKISGTVC